MSGRRYNTSCDPCRRSRIGCDAILQRPNPCTNCLRRGKNCGSSRHGVRTRSTAARDKYNSTDSRRSGDSDDSATTRSFTQPETLAESPMSRGSSSPWRQTDLEIITNRRMQMVALHHLLWDVFVLIWDSRAALWLGSSCNPFLETSVDNGSLISRIVLEADRFLAEFDPRESQRPRNISDTSRLFSRRNDGDKVLDDAVNHAVYVYASRYLPFRRAFRTTLGIDEERAQKMEQDIRNQLWRRARTSIYAVMARPSYRSILALLIFTFTEMPTDNEDPGFGRLCSEVLFSHFNYMRFSIHRQRARILSEYTTVSSLDDEVVESSSPRTSQDNGDTVGYLFHSIFWLGVICDSTRSLMQQSPSVILPGRSGDGKVWNLIRQRNVIFDQSFRSLHESPLPLDKDVTDIILQHALACKTMYFGILSQFFDAAIFSKAESVEDAAQRVLEESQRFHNTLSPLLSLCARDYTTLRAGRQLNYTLITIHYHLGTLILAEVLDSLDACPVQLQDPRLSRLFACTMIVNALSLALNYDRFSGDESRYDSILLHDPTPITMVEALSHTSKAIFLLHETGKIDIPTAQMMTSVVCAGLTILSQVSVTPSFVLTWLRRKCARSKIRFKPDSLLHAPTEHKSEDHFELLSMCDRNFIDEFLQEMKLLEASGGQSLVASTIAKYETLPIGSGAGSTVLSDDTLLGGDGDNLASCDRQLNY